MNVIHILSDGSRVEDITGHVVRVADAEALYNMIREINCKTNDQKNTYSFRFKDRSR